jgi:DNA-binding NarL/FixJ family response regulator
MSDIRVVLADDHTIVRQGLRCLLSQVDGIEVVGEVENGHQLLQVVAKLKPDVIILDLSMPIMEGQQATELLKKEYPQVKILVLTMHTNEEFIYNMFKLGISGYLVKKATAEEIITAIKAVHQNETYISPTISHKFVQEYLRGSRSSPQPAFPDKLTFRERQILKLIAEGWASSKIAEHLHISVRTVETHRNNIMQKLKLHKVADLVKYAIRRNLVQIEP